MKKVIPLLAACIMFASCSVGHSDAYYSAQNREYSGYDILEDFHTEFDTFSFDPSAEETVFEVSSRELTYADNYTGGSQKFPMRVYNSMDVYETVECTKVVKTLKNGTRIILEETGTYRKSGEPVAAVYDEDGNGIGFACSGFISAIGVNCGAYAELPIEYGKAKTNNETYVDAYSHLVDVRKYFRTYSTTSEDFSGIDLENTDIIISMKLSTDDTSIGEPFYNSNICMLQYDILPKLKDAVGKFQKDGYTVIIYDAYRPTSVQQKWFNVVRVHKWVADPSIGMGGVHDRGTCIDMSLVDSEGNLLEMPTPMHTFTEASSRLSKTMSAKARENMNYMLGVMVSCGFTYINSEWWHFQDVNTQYYLPTDHPIDDIPLLVSESGREVGR